MKRQERVIRRDGLARRRRLGSQLLNRPHPRISVGEQGVAEPQRVKGPHDVGGRLVGQRTDHGLHEGAIERQVEVREPGHGGEGAVVRWAVASKRTDVVERALFEAGDPVAGDEATRRHVGRPRRNDHFMETGWQTVDDIHHLDEFLVLLGADLGGDEDGEMSDRVAQAINDGSAGGADVVNVAIEVEDPAEGLRRRTDVVFRRGEHDDRRGDVAEIEDRAVVRLDLVTGQLVADEKIVHQELHLVAVELDEVAPPFLELQVALRTGVDVRVDLVLLAPEPVGRIQRVEIQDQARAVELPVTKVARQGGEPASAEQAARIAHRVLSMDALPIGHGGSGDQARAEEVRPQHGHHQCLIAGLAVTDRKRARYIRMEFDHTLEELHLSLDDVEELLAGLGDRAEADKIHRVARLQGVADLALRLEAADTRSLAGAGIDHHDRPFAGVGRTPWRR